MDAHPLPLAPLSAFQLSALCSFEIIVNCPLDQIPDVLHDVSAHSLGHDSRLICIALGAPRGNTDRMTRLLILPPVFALPPVHFEDPRASHFRLLGGVANIFLGWNLDRRLSRRTYRSAPIALSLIYFVVSHKAGSACAILIPAISASAAASI